MKKVIPSIKLAACSALCILSLSLLYPACTNEFDLTADWKEIVVVYGLLDANETTHYVRIEKAFLDEETSALEIARIPDSLYFDNLTVELRELPAASLVGTFELVDGDSIGLPREPGTFAESPNYLYRVNAILNPGRSYQLRIVNGETGKVTTAETSLVPSFTISFPGANAQLNWSYNESQAQNFVWNKVGSAAFYDLNIIVRYTEFPVSNPATVEEKTISWKAQRNVIPAPNLFTVTTKLNGEGFFRFVGTTLTKDVNVRRCFKEIFVKVDAGSELLYDYIQAQEAGVGLAGGVAPLPNFTNLSEGRGIFASRTSHTLANSITLTNMAFDSLLNGYYTKQSGFLPKNDPLCQ